MPCNEPLRREVAGLPRQLSNATCSCTRRQPLPPRPRRRTLPQKLQKYLECWLTSIFLICFLSEAP